MNARAWLAALPAAALLVVAAAGSAPAYELEPGLNDAAVIDYPTALDQPVDHALHGTLALYDVAEPDLRLANLRYGFQLGNAQFLADVNYLPGTKEFGYGEAKGKLRVLSLHEFRTYVAVGGVARGSGGDREKARALYDDRPYSLLAVLTTELFPFARWGGFRLNLYLDNVHAVGGLKVQLYPLIKLVGEVQHRHTTELEERTRSRVGLELEGEQNFYFQLFYDNRLEKYLVQIGSGF